MRDVFRQIQFSGTNQTVLVTLYPLQAAAEEQARYDKEYHEYQEKLEKEKKKFQEEHPDEHGEFDDDDPSKWVSILVFWMRILDSNLTFVVIDLIFCICLQYESPQARELRQIFDGQTDIQHTVRLLHKKIDEITVRQDTAVNQVLPFVC